MKLQLLFGAVIFGFVFSIHAVPFGNYQRTTPKLNSYLKKLSTNYLSLLKNFLTRQKYHGSGVISRRSILDDIDVMEELSRRSLDDNDIINQAPLDYDEGDLLRRNSIPKPDIMSNYLKRISSTYLNMIKKFLAKGRGRVRKRSDDEIMSSYKTGGGEEDYLSKRFQKEQDDSFLTNSAESLEEKELLTKLATVAIDRELKREMLGYAASNIVAEEEQPMLNKRESPMLNRRESEFLSEENSPMLNKRDSPMLNKRESPMLNKRDSPMLNKRESPMLNKRESPMLNRRDSLMLAEENSPMLNKREESHVFNSKEA